MRHPHKVLLLLLVSAHLAVFAREDKPGTALDLRIDSLLSRMTIEEKVGQLVLMTFRSKSAVDSTALSPALEAEVQAGKIGSLLNAVGADLTHRIQRVAVEDSRLGIPLLFGFDVIHGFRTVFPIPLAEASTWEPDLVRQSARVAAVEAAASGLHWTFAPMVDIARDPRWGRIAEGSGEDPFLGSLMAASRVMGFQGEDVGDQTSLVACPKHFAAYGGAEGGRDYNTVDISERTLREVYLPPFEAAVKAGAATIMCSFNEIGGVPSTANSHLLTDILRGEWGFQGFVVSDWGSVAELQEHGIAATHEDAALLALTAGVDMDMEGNAYHDYCMELVQSGKLSVEVLDKAVRRVLRVKFMLGLFENPYRSASSDREQKTILSPSHRQLARDVARRSLVLLKNDAGLLPVREGTGLIAVVGPLADDSESILGPWHAAGRAQDAISVLRGLRARAGKRILYAKGCEIDGNSTGGFAEALDAARKADVVIAVLGEASSMSGEAASRATLGLPGVQEQLLDEILKAKKPVAVVLMNGRPLAIPGIHERATAVLETWFAGVEGGNAVADVLFGDVNPSGKLPATFPYSVGQIPLYYNHKNTGRPPVDSVKWNSKYIDSPSIPLYPFGYGLSYTRFVYRSLTLEKLRISPGEHLTVSVEVLNAGDRQGEEAVQLYIRYLAGSVTRPVKELRGFVKISLRPGEARTVNFILTPASLSMLNPAMKRVVEPGAFLVQVGGNSRDVLTGRFEVSGD